MRAPVPKVATFHADPPAWVRRLYRGLDSRVRSLTRPGTLVTAVSRQAAAALPGRWGPERIIPNGVDAPDSAAPVKRERGKVVFLGRDEPRKGLDVLLEAWPEIRRRHPRARLAVMGASRTEAPDGGGLPGPGQRRGQGADLGFGRDLRGAQPGGREFRDRAGGGHDRRLRAGRLRSACFPGRG